MAANQERILTQLETSRYQFGVGEDNQIVKLLKRLDAAHFDDPASLIRFHEAVLFLRAFPQSPQVLSLTERILKSFRKKVGAIRQSKTNMEEFDSFATSGIAGTQMEDTLSFDVARWLVRRLPGQVEVAWDNYDPGRELFNTGPRFLPLLEDDANVEADTPWRRWLEDAAGKKTKTAAWLIERFEKL